MLDGKNRRKILRSLARKAFRKKQNFSALLSLTIFLMVIFHNLTLSANSINELYIFGDSLSDVGNVFKLTEQARPPSPPYYSGRYSNGRLWVEYLVQELQLSPERVKNSAWGGATTQNSFGNIQSLKQQIENFLASNNSISSQALCILWIGANDYLYGATNVTETVENIIESVFVLVQAGAKNFLIVNLPDLGKLPATRNTKASSSLSALTKAHNLYLSQALKRLTKDLNSSFAIIEWDVYSLYQEVINNPNKFGLTNVRETCLKERSICQHPEQFLFWDGVHPTAITHQILGKEALSKITAFSNSKS